MKKGAWSTVEEDKLVKLIEQYGRKWAKIAKILRFRSGKQVRHHYINVLEPSNKKTCFTVDEDMKIKALYMKIGPKWQEISKHLLGRTGDAIKSRYYNKLRFVIDNEILQNYIHKDYTRDKQMIDVDDEANFSESNQLLFQKINNLHNNITFENYNKDNDITNHSTNSKQAEFEVSNNYTQNIKHNFFNKGINKIEQDKSESRNTTLSKLFIFNCIFSYLLYIDMIDHNYSNENYKSFSQKRYSCQDINMISAEKLLSSLSKSF